MKILSLIAFVLVSTSLCANNGPRPEVVSINAIKFSPSSGLSSEHTFRISDSVSSFSLHLLSNAKKLFYVYELIAPSGEKIITKTPRGVSQELLQHKSIKGRGQILSPNGAWYSVFYGVSSLVVPNHPSVKLEGGRWRVRFAVEKDPNISLERKVKAHAKLILKHKTGPSQPGRQSLNLNVYGTPKSRIGNNLSDVKRNLGQSIEYFQSIGINLKINNFKVLPSKYDRLSDDRQRFPERFNLLEELWKGKESILNNSVRSIDVFFTKRNNYSNKGFATFAGATLSMADPNIVSGVSIFTESNIDYNLTFAHELCHHLGLYHTNVDFFDDTNTNRHILFGEQDWSHNLMHIKPTAMYLSRQQIEVIKNNPALIDER